MRYYANLKIAKEILWDKLNREPYDEEIAPLMGVSLEKLMEILAKLNQFGSLPINPDYPMKSHTQLTPVEELIETETNNILRESIIRLKPRTRAVIAFHYYGGLHGYEIAGILGISTGRVSQIKRRGLKFIKERMLTLYGGVYED